MRTRKVQKKSTRVKTCQKFPDGVMPPFYLHNELKKIVPHLFPCQANIYHYTTADVLTKLTCTNACFYATHYMALNDNSEYEKGTEYALKEYLPRYHPELDALLHSQFPELYKDGDENDMEVRLCYVPWVVSFSRKADLLSQWIAYTSKEQGGFSIGYNFDRVESLIAMAVKVKRERYSFDKSALDYEMHFLPCVYLDKNNPSKMADVHKILQFMFGRYYSEKVSYLSQQKKKERAVYALLIVNLFAAIAKHSSFSEEDEFRLVLLVKNEGFLDQGEFIGGKPRIKLPLREETSVPLNGLIAEVYVSPHGDKRLLHSIVEFTKYKNKLRYAVKDSSSPYNGR